MAGTTRPSVARELRKPAVRAAPRSRASVMQERSETPMGVPRSVAALRNQRSPSVMSTGGTKRKDRDFEPPTAIGDTNIRVVVRCRGRNDREVKENSGVVVSADGVKGTTVELLMGPNALGNKTYQFDKVFSPAADQAILYDDVVTPILDEMLAGYNCTIFAYGQTGTGKTYTMSGDMTDTLGLLSDAAGIIPRVLYSLFQKLEDRENSVKCSFIELYNEELRDLLSSEDSSNKLKIFEDGVKKGHNSTMVQGMGETYIHSAHEGIKVLQEGSRRRQVAATKCNDLSSRSHTVFTITAFIKRTTESGEEFVSSGKLNLVDLAGSENIQRSGAENKRAAEAGLINKSLLTLGRVINALVDKSPHIPYRESKLTRLLQDSLGGHTKTCIIATVSPARSNLEETISTLDYAFRAKNIRNKPQINSTISKKTLLREFTTEIEKLKIELIATRQRNGVYLSPGAYEELTVESESRRILSEEQRAKLETMEANLKNKVQELFTLTSNFNGLKKDNEATREKLEETEDVLEKTEIVLQDTRRSLEEEAMLRKAHEDTENQLFGIGTGILSTLETSVTDVTGLHAKLERRAELHDGNREKWQSATSQVLDFATLLNDKVISFQTDHTGLVTDLAAKMRSYVAKEQENLGLGDSVIRQTEKAFDAIQQDAEKKLAQDRDNMNHVLEEIKVLREDVKQKVGQGLNGLSNAAARISGEVIDELEQFHVELCGMYNSLKQDFSIIFESLADHLKAQKGEADKLRRELQEANQRAMDADEQAASRLEAVLEEERREAEAERCALLTQIGRLVNEMGEKQAARVEKKVQDMQGDMKRTRSAMREADTRYGQGMDKWAREQDNFLAHVVESETKLSRQIDSNLTTLDTWNSSIRTNTSAVHGETVRIVEAQKEDIAVQMQALDAFVTRARSQNGAHHESSIKTLSTLAAKVGDAHSEVRRYLDELRDQTNDFESRSTEQNGMLKDSVEGLTVNLRKPLSELRSVVQQTTMADYIPTGTTPQKRAYDHPTVLPRTEPHENILSRLRDPESPSHSSNRSTPVSVQSPASLADSRSPSPSRGSVFNDGEDEEGAYRPPPEQSPVRPGPAVVTGLRELDVNVVPRPQTTATAFGPGISDSVKLGGVPGANDDGLMNNKDLAGHHGEMLPPPAKRHFSSRMSANMLGVGQQKVVERTNVRRLTRNIGVVGEGRENVPLPAARQLGGRRRLRSSNVP